MKEQTLTLRHLSGYLPYGLKCQRIPISDLWDEKIVELTALDAADNIAIFHKSADYYFDDAEKEFNIKPLLIPLSELTEEQWVEVFKAGTGQPLGKVNLTDFPYVSVKGEDDRLLVYNSVYRCFYGYKFFNQLAAFEKLYELHADLDNLLESGLALNKNTNGK